MHGRTDARTQGRKDARTEWLTDWLIKSDRSSDRADCFTFVKFISTPDFRFIFFVGRRNQHSSSNGTRSRRTCSWKDERSDHIWTERKSPSTEVSTDKYLIDYKLTVPKFKSVVYGRTAQRHGFMCSWTYSVPFVSTIIDFWPVCTSMVPAWLLRRTESKRHSALSVSTQKMDTIEPPIADTSHQRRSLKPLYLSLKLF